MAHLIPTTKQPRRGAHYSREEILVISKYKAEYKDQTTRALRANVLRNNILVDLFNYWDVQGTLPSDEAASMERVKELAAWVRNNWRPNTNATQNNPTIKIRAINYVWDTRRDAVEEELKTLLGVEELDQRDPRYFQQRNAAAKLALEKMSVEEKAELELGLERRRTEGNSENVQRYRAERHRRKALQTFSRERWLDMGMSTITFTVHIDEQGRFIGDMHEDVLHNLGIHGRNFAELHEALVVDMTRKFLAYAKSARLEVADPEIADRRHAEPDVVEIRMTRDGFPIIPKLVMEKELRKSEWEKMLRAFVTQHYYLASGQKSRQVPYSAIKSDTASFVPDEYRPSGIILQDPRNMQLDDVRKVLRHCYGRQAESGPESAFRFALFIGPKRKRLFANYADPSNTQPGPSQSEQTRRKKNKGKQREYPLKGLIPLDELLEPTTDHIDTVGPNANAAGPSNYHSPSRETSDPHTGAQQHDLVRIDMGQMLQLKDMGYEVMGPVNGPSEGYPEYEVPRAMLAALIAHSQTQSALHPSAADIALGPSTSGSAPIPIDPALLCQANDTPHHTSTSHEPLPNTGPHVQSPIHSSTNNVRPTTPLNNDAESVDKANGTHERTPKKRLGKRAQANANLSPQTVRQTRSTKKKKKMTNDDLAAMEAQNMLQSGSRRRTKTTKRKQ